jgi:hypothetical protein
LTHPDLPADAAAAPAPSRLHDGGSTQPAVERASGGAGQPVDAHVAEAREARHRADEMLQAAQEATRKAQLARERADALDERAALLEASSLARLKQRTRASVPDQTQRPCGGP